MSSTIMKSESDHTVNLHHFTTFYNLQHQFVKCAVKVTFQGKKKSVFSSKLNVFGFWSVGWAKKPNLNISTSYTNKKKSHKEQKENKNKAETKFILLILSYSEKCWIHSNFKK